MSIEQPGMLEKAIARTVVFFDLFDYPLTDSEIAKFLLCAEEALPAGVRDVRRALSSSPYLASVFECSDGMIGLVGRARMLSLERRERWVIAYRKYARAKRVIRVLARLPFVRMICVCNTLGLSAARDDSDIDLFIVARAGHLWTVRMLCTGVVHLLGLRPRKGRERDTLCLSFYASDDALDFSGLQLAGWTRDIYLAYWISWCVPMYDDNTYDRFFQANAWIRFVIPHVIPHAPIPWRRVALGPVGRRIKKAFEGMVRSRAVEHAARALQYRLFPRAIRDQMNQGGGVVVSDSMLKFHTTDRRQEIKERFERCCGELNL